MTVSTIDAVALATLTPREREVLILVCKGFHSPEIRDLIGIERHTVNDHIKAIYRKLNVSTRPEAAVIAAKAGWV